MRKVSFVLNLIIILAVSLSAGFFISTKIYNDQWQDMMSRVNDLLEDKRFNLVEDDDKSDKSESLTETISYNLNNKIWLIADKKDILSKKSTDNILDKVHFDKDFIGSAVIVTNDGWLITNDSIKDLKNLTVINNKNEIIKVDSIVEDPVLNISYLKIDKSNLEPIAIADSDSLEIGQNVYAIKPNLYNYQNEIILNSLRSLHSRFIEKKQDLVHDPDDIVIYGLLNTYSKESLPLVNLKSQFIGFSINFNNQSYLLPSKYIRYSLTNLFNDGNEIIYPTLGISYIDLSEVVVDSDLPANGALVYKVVDNNSLFKKNDIIMSIENDQINEIRSLNTILLDYKIGDEINIVFTRNGEEKEVKYIIKPLVNESR